MTTFGYYAWIKNDKELKAMADEMIAYARQHPFDPDAVQDMMANEPGQKEVIEGDLKMVRVHGKEAGNLTNNYARFITFSASSPRPLPLQVAYYEYLPPGEKVRVKQLTIVHNNKEPVHPGEITRIGHFFLDLNKGFLTVKTPPHVFVVMQNEEIPNES